MRLIPLCLSVRAARRRRRRANAARAYVRIDEAARRAQALVVRARAVPYGEPGALVLLTGICDACTAEAAAQDYWYRKWQATLGAET